MLTPRYLIWNSLFPFLRFFLSSFPLSGLLQRKQEVYSLWSFEAQQVQQHLDTMKEEEERTSLRVSQPHRNTPRNAYEDVSFRLPVSTMNRLLFPPSVCMPLLVVSHRAFFFALEKIRLTRDLPSVVEEGKSQVSFQPGGAEEQKHSRFSDPLSG